MAETLPSLDLDRIERDAEALVMTSPATVLALVAEIRSIRAACTAITARHLHLAAAMSAALENDAKEAEK